MLPIYQTHQTNYLFLHSAEIGHCHFTQPLATTLNPIWRARKESDLSWYWEGATLTILPSMRALVPNFWQLDVWSFLLSASFRIRSPSDKLISSARCSNICFYVPSPAKFRDCSQGEPSPPSPRSRWCSIMEREQEHFYSMWPDPRSSPKTRTPLSKCHWHH